MSRLRASSEAGSPLGASPRAPWLGVTGTLMLVFAFVGFNSFFGVFSKRWPWEVIADGAVALRAKSILVAWLLAGLWCIAFGWLPTRRTRIVGSAFLASLLLIEIGRGGGGHLLGQSDVLLVLLLGALGAGFLLAREPSARGRGRLLAGMGGLLVLWGTLTAGTSGQTWFEHWLHDLEAFFGDVGGAFSDRAEHLWGTLLPQTLVMVASLLGLLAALGLTGRRFLGTAFVLLLLASPVHIAAGVVFGGGSPFEALPGQIAAANFLPWLLAVFTACDLGHLHGGAR